MLNGIFDFIYKKEPRCRVNYNGANTWQRPTLTGPIVPLPSALRRFTSGFGMGPGGSNALWSPEGNPDRSGLGLWGSELCFIGLISPIGLIFINLARPLSDIHMEIVTFFYDS